MATAANDVIRVDDVVGKYIQLRDKLDEMEAAHKAAVKPIKTAMDKLEAWLKAKADADGVDSLKTAHGTAYKSLKDSATVAAWDELLAYIRDNEAFELLNRAVNKTAVRELAAGGAVPPGVKYEQWYEINVRRAS